MFIQTETTPNPETLKFIPGQPVMENDRTVDFTNLEEAAISPLAKAIFEIGEIKRVFLGSDFISVTRAGSHVDWAILKPQILAAVMDHYLSGAPVLLQGEKTADYGEDTDIVIHIKELLDSRIRPAVANDGGDITFRGFKEGIVYLSMRGACSGCPSATATLKYGIERLLKHYIPEIISVQAVN